MPHFRLCSARHARAQTGAINAAAALIGTMTATPSRKPVKFGELAVGQRFYDPVSAEYFVKQSDELAAMVTGIGDGTVPDEFDMEDVVGIDL